MCPTTREIPIRNDSINMRKIPKDLIQDRKSNQAFMGSVPVNDRAPAKLSDPDSSWDPRPVFQCLVLQDSLRGVNVSVLTGRICFGGMRRTDTLSGSCYCSCSVYSNFVKWCSKSTENMLDYNASKSDITVKLWEKKKKHNSVYLVIY